MNIQDFARVREALKRSRLIVLHLYCQRSECAVREVDVRVKDYNEDFIHVFGASGGGICPSCAGALKLHDVLTAEDEYEKRSPNRPLTIIQRVQ